MGSVSQGDSPLVSERFEAFSGQHFFILGLFVLGSGLVIWAGRMQRGTASEARSRRAFAAAIVVFAVPLQVLQILPGDWDLGTSLPLALCDFAWMTGVYGLWTRKPWASALTYFWGLTLTTQAIITPSLAEAFPHPRFFGFWAEHFLVVWAALYLTWGLAVRPTWRDYRIAVAATAIWAVTVFTFNVAAGTNYGYLNRKPPSASILDVMGSWPGYVVVEIAVVSVLWALMTWPWTVRARPAPASEPSTSSGGQPLAGSNG